MLNGMVFGGVFHRHPKLTLVFAELGIHWFAGAVQHMDNRGPASPESGVYMGHYAYELTPSEFVRRNVRITPLPRLHQSPVRLLEELPECVVFSSDYAHNESNPEPTAHYEPILADVQRRRARVVPRREPRRVLRSHGRSASRRHRNRKLTASADDRGETVHGERVEGNVNSCAAQFVRHGMVVVEDALDPRFCEDVIARGSRISVSTNKIGSRGKRGDRRRLERQIAGSPDVRTSVVAQSPKDGWTAGPAPRPRRHHLRPLSAACSCSA